MNNESAIRTRFEKLVPFLNERTRRLFTAAEAVAIGRGGITAVTRATGVSRRAVTAGLAELHPPPEGPVHRIRRPGGGRKRRVQADHTLQADLERLIDPVTRGDPESPLRWTCKSVRKLAEELRGLGHTISHRMVAELLHELGYSLQANRKTVEGKSHPDRNAQFEYIKPKCRRPCGLGSRSSRSMPRRRSWLAISRTPGGSGGRRASRSRCGCTISSTRSWARYPLRRLRHRPTTRAGSVWGPITTRPSLRWRAFAGGGTAMGQATYPRAKRLLITADGGGSNGSRVRLWKLELQRLADATGLELRCATSPREPASGTRSSIGCSPSSPRTGAGNRW